MAYTPTAWAQGDVISSAKMNKLEQGVAGADGMVDVLYKLTKGQAWDIVQDNTTAYVKTLPSGTHLSVLNGWGGKTIADSGEIKHGDVTSIVLKSARQTTVKTLTVPAAVRALTGYGWGAGSAANTVEYDAINKKWYYHQRVTRAKIDGETLYFAGDGEFWNINPRNVIIGKTTGAHLNGTTLLGALDGVDLWYNSNNKFAYLLGSEAAELGFTSKEDANAKLQADPTWLYYELATEEVTDITNLMTGFDNYLKEVEPGGTLTFVNSNGADYSIPVPSQIDNYMNLSEVTP